eukprot:10469463-Karenia_brevis.AAC.1
MKLTAKSVTKVAYARALIWHFFPHETLGTKEFLVQQWASWQQKKSPVADTKLLLACVDAMDPEEREFFKVERELIEKVVLRRSEADGRSPWYNWTPQAIKDLIPQ